MGAGWKDSLLQIYGRGMHVFLKEKIFRSGVCQEFGDIDVVIEHSQPFPIQQMFPSEHHPRLTLDLSSRHYLAEIKATINEEHIDEKCEQFVHTYLNLLRKDRAAVINEELLGATVKRAIDDPSTILIFLYGGDELPTVEAYMQRAIYARTQGTRMMICGRRVVCINCRSHHLIHWGADMLLEHLTTENALLRQRLAQYEGAYDDENDHQEEVEEGNDEDDEDAEEEEDKEEEEDEEEEEPLSHKRKRNKR